MLLIITIISMILFLSPSMEIQASEKKWDLTVRYELDYYSMKPVVEVRLANNKIDRDYVYSINVGVINGNKLEQQFVKNNLKFRYNSFDKFYLNNFSGDNRILSVIVQTEDPSGPLKQVAFEIYNFPEERYEIDQINYNFVFEKEILADYNADTLEIKYEYLNFGALLDTNKLISSTIVDFSKWNFHYDTDGVVIKRGYDSAQVCFSDGFAGSDIKFDSQYGYCFDLSYVKIDDTVQGPLVGFELINTYIDEKENKYYKDNPDGDYKEVKSLKLNSMQNEIEVTLLINKEGVNKLNFTYNFKYVNDVTNEPGEFRIGNTCTDSRFCIVKLDDSLEFKNYKVYKVGGIN